jgi:hypothetical protein
MRADRDSPTPKPRGRVHTGLHGDDGGADATQGSHTLRDDGRFGSAPSYDDMDA